jgi:hypothetical protein
MGASHGCRLDRLACPQDLSCGFLADLSRLAGRETGSGDDYARLPVRQTRI